MNLLITWVVSLMLIAVVIYTSMKERPGQDADQKADNKAPLRHRIASLFATLDYLSWALLIAAVCFLIAAIAQTIGTLS